MSDINSPMNACMYKGNCLETIRTQQATIERLTEHAKKLITNTMLFDGATLETVTSNFGMDEWIYELKALIAEIERSKS